MQPQVMQFGDEGQLATRELLRRFGALSAALPGAFEPLRQQLAMLETLDRQHGGAARLELEDTQELVAAIHGQLAQWQAQAPSQPPDARSEAIADLVIGVALWAQRHQVALSAVEPIANALALRSNR
ncbi:MAG TPA: hypothetical protein VN878_04540, partial [Usitatibacter sp.]|nr:hypothetical protein [Usitatibacter sp.]